ncbi:hypothetical protein ACFLSX_05485, partial [Calditrichota bacterium]
MSVLLKNTVLHIILVKLILIFSLNAHNNLNDHLVLATKNPVNNYTIEIDTIEDRQENQQVSSSLPTLAVIGMSNEIRNEDWRDERVGLGLKIILSQLFYESGYFTMLEEKPEIRQKLNKMVSGIWTLNQEDYNFENDAKSIKEFGADFVAYGKVYYYGKPRMRVSLGPLHMRKNSVIIKVEITLEDLKSGKTISERGEGQSKTTANSALFKFREDHVDLDKTNIGNATKKA